MWERERPEGFVSVIPGSALALCAKLFVGTAFLYLAPQFLDFQRFFKDDAEGVGALFEIIGTLYTALYALATSVIWGQFTAVENEILKASGALKTLLRFSGRLKADNTREPVGRAP